MDLLEFLNTRESREIIKDLTIAERVKFATAFQWAREKPTPEEARDKAKQKCSEEAISKRHEEGNTSFESELASISAIQEIAGLTNEEAEQLDNDVFTGYSVSDDIRETVNTAFKDRGVEDAIIEALCSIHDNWMRNHGNNFQKPGRDKDYQFVDLRLMPFGDDGATADLIFLRPILESCGIEIDMERLEQRFNEMQEEFMKTNGITSAETLHEYLSKGADNNQVLEGLIAGDENGKTIDEILRENPEVVNHMTEQVMSKLPKHVKINLDELTPQVMEEYSETISETETAIRDDMTKDKDELTIDE
ncbi:MAG: hypothetical protein IKF17_02220 [Clostridia bacterium]|nr:hypothetical protein [Clostridia bacterium]